MAKASRCRGHSFRGVPPEPEPLEERHHRGAATVFADAFLNDPGWIAVGPRDERRRRKYIFRTCLGAIRIGAHWAGPSWCVTEGDQPVAVLTGCAPGLWPPPKLRSAIRIAPGPLLAGPPVLIRSIGAERVFERHHPAYPHFLVWMFAVSPERQRSGLGGQLMRRALVKAEDDDVPTYLWTGNSANLPYYRSHGFELLGKEVIPGGAMNWFMERPCRRRSETNPP